MNECRGENVRHYKCGGEETKSKKALFENLFGKINKFGRHYSVNGMRQNLKSVKTGIC